MTVHAMNHFTVLTDDIEKTVAFYERYLGLSVGERPDLGFPGAWLYAGGQAILHVIAGRPLPAQPAGVLDHMAFSATGLKDTIALLEADGIAHTSRKQAGGGVWQVVLHDPNGAKVEIDFDPDEAAA